MLLSVPMTTKLSFFALIGFLTACGGSDEQDDDITCDPADRFGTYWLDFETLSGNCGEQADGLVQVGAGDTPGCTELAAPRLSDNDCTIESRVACDLSEQVYVEAVGITTQQDSSGDVITGTMTMTVYDLGEPVCAGSYGMRYERQ